MKMQIECSRQNLFLGIMGIDIYFERVKTNPDGDRYFLIFNSNFDAVTVCGEELKHSFDRTVFMIHSTKISTLALEKFQSTLYQEKCSLFQLISTHQ